MEDNQFTDISKLTKVGHGIVRKISCKIPKQTLPISP